MADARAIFLGGAVVFFGGTAGVLMGIATVNALLWKITVVFSPSVATAMA
ncbi:hypothetical protein [Paraburkholderia hayleyella]|nr:hypothetical protein [Paraburkholderia hayleyella]